MYKITKIAAAIALTTVAVSVQAENAPTPGYAPAPVSFAESEKRRAAMDKERAARRAAAEKEMAARRAEMDKRFASESAPAGRSSNKEMQERRLL